jgi:hypothetical protein
MSTSEAKRWDDPAFWERVSVGYCAGCKEGHVLKDGLCWNCRARPCNRQLSHGVVTLRCGRITGHPGLCAPKPSPMPDYLIYPNQA